MSPADEQPAPSPVAKLDGNGVGTHSSDARELVKDVVNAKEAGPGSGLWTRARG
jgi:hypothetical protein